MSAETIAALIGAFAVVLSGVIAWVGGVVVHGERIRALQRRAEDQQREMSELRHVVHREVTDRLARIEENVKTITERLKRE